MPAPGISKIKNITKITTPNPLAKSWKPSVQNNPAIRRWPECWLSTTLPRCTKEFWPFFVIWAALSRWRTTALKATKKRSIYRLT